MRRLLPILLLALVAGTLAFGLAYRSQTRPSHPLPAENTPAELAWIRHEFHLTDAQFTRVAALHEAYKPTCAELCRRIADQNERLRAAVTRTNALSDELRTLVAETGRARDDCRQAMLAHLYAVAAEMPPADGRRYLDIMLGATCVLQNARPIDTIHPGTATPTSTHDHAHHEGR